MGLFLNYKIPLSAKLEILNTTCCSVIAFGAQVQRCETTFGAQVRRCETGDIKYVVLK